MKTNYRTLFGGVMTALVILLILSVPYKGESVLTRLVRASKVLA